MSDKVHAVAGVRTRAELAVELVRAGGAGYGWWAMGTTAMSQRTMTSSAHFLAARTLRISAHGLEPSAGIRMSGSIDTASHPTKETDHAIGIERRRSVCVRVGRSPFVRRAKMLAHRGVVPSPMHTKHFRSAGSAAGSSGTFGNTNRLNAL